MPLFFFLSLTIKNTPNEHVPKISCGIIAPEPRNHHNYFLITWCGEMKTVSVSKCISVFLPSHFPLSPKDPLLRTRRSGVTLRPCESVGGKKKKKEKGQATKAGFVPQSILNTYQPHLDAGQIYHSINTDTQQTHVTSKRLKK